VSPLEDKNIIAVVVMDAAGLFADSLDYEFTGYRRGFHVVIPECVGASTMINHDRLTRWTEFRFNNLIELEIEVTVGGGIFSY
jgi:hypothetical protein